MRSSIPSSNGMSPAGFSICGRSSGMLRGSYRVLRVWSRRMPNPDRTWAGAAAVAVLGGALTGIGGLLAVLGFNGPLAVVYALAALVALTAVVTRSSPPQERDEDFW